MAGSSSPRKTRLDQLLVSRGFFQSRQQAQRAILAGEVLLPERIAEKPGMQLSPDAAIEVRARQRYVSRGGEKLEAALEHFQIDVKNAVCLDIGASTGGFTDCLLQRGAARVYAIDVGHGQLAWKLRQDPRVILKEKLNARNLDQDDIPEAIDLAAADVSFISLTLVLPPAVALLEPGARMVALIKPQFELERQAIGKGGIVRDEDSRLRAIEKVREFVIAELRQQWEGFLPSPVRGAEGNQEYLACLRKSSA